MACGYCNHRGYIETFTARDAGWKPSIAQCPRCQDTRAYSDEIYRRMNGLLSHTNKDKVLWKDSEPCAVVEFRRLTRGKWPDPVEDKDK